MARRGHPISAATRAKISASRRGKSHPHRGHPVSAATRAKIAAALRARHPAMSREERLSRRRAAYRARVGPRTARERVRAHQSTHGRRTVGRGAVNAHTAAARIAAAERVGQRVHLTGTVRPHRPHRSAYSLLSTGAGYHRSYAGRLRRARGERSSRIRVRRHTYTHHVRPRRR